MEQEQQPKQNENFKIVGGNLLAMIVYTVLSKFSDAGLIFDALFLLVHVMLCWIFAITNKSWMWFLAGLLVLLIGASTCVRFLAVNQP